MSKGFDSHHGAISRLGLLVAITVLLITAIPATASAAPIWRLTSTSNTTVAPGDGSAASSEFTLIVQPYNDGDEAVASASPTFVRIELPAGMTGVEAVPGFNVFPCPDFAGAVGPASVTCETQTPVKTKKALSFSLNLSVDSVAAAGVLTPTLEIYGGGAVRADGSACAQTPAELASLPVCDATVDPVMVTTAPPVAGFEAFDAKSVDPEGENYTQAGGHPHSIANYLDFNAADDPRFAGFGPAAMLGFPVEPVRDVFVDLPPGVIGNPAAFSACSLVDLSNSGSSPLEVRPLCPPASQLGTVIVHSNAQGEANFFGPFSLYNMPPPPGSVARFGFNILGTLIVFDANLRSQGEYRVTVGGRNISEGLAASGSLVDFWGVPGDERHRSLRACSGELAPYPEGSGSDPGPTCAGGAEAPFLRMPTSCPPAGQGLPWKVAMDTWQQPAAQLAGGAPDLSDPNWHTTSIESHKDPGYPFSPEDPSTPWGDPQGPTDCQDVPVKGSLTAQPTALETETSSGLEVHVEVPNPGLENKDGIASSDLKNVKVTLPQGVTINPSQASGLGVCSPSQYESSELSFHPDGTKGCPSDSKIGTVSVKTPLLEETIPGNVYVAKPYDNPFNSLLAIYIVLEEPRRGILVKLPGEIRTNEQTGRIEGEFSNLPQFPFSTFDFKFREGARAPLITPPTCGSYQTLAEITGWSDPDDPITSKSSFQITRGIGGAPCPKGGTPSFKPGFSAGTINNNAGSYSPFNLRLTRLDGEQDMTRFSAVLPPGVLGKLAGVSKCPDSAIAAAKAKSGLEERANPSCPANSQIGRSIVGAGVGSVLTYVPGKIYLGGPVAGDPLSVIAITPAVAGPFDVGTVVVRQALTLNPRTAEVEVDGAASDPIPHILKGIPAKLRDLRVYVDRDKFTLNPTSCDPSATDASLFGGGGNAFTSTDDVPVFLQDRFQASNCAALGFKPRLGLKLKGGTKRGGHPGLQATYRPRSGDANVEGLVVRLPRSAFLDQAHIRTICTRVQFAADACPKGAQYGYIKAFTPLLDEPLEGPVWLRSSDHKLPDLVFDLHGLVDVEVATRIDSIKGGIRATVDQIPDAPLSKVLLKMQGAKKGLIINSRNLCTSTSRAYVQSDGQNGKISDFNPVLRPDCGKKRGGRGKRR